MNLRSWLEAFVVAATGLALVAHGGGTKPICALQNAESVDFDVVGSCGPAGRVNVSMKDGSCGLYLEGDDVGVPMHGEAGGVRSGGWHTSGKVPLHDNEQLSCSTYHVDSTIGGRYEMECIADGRRLCTSYFIETSENCDVRACSVPECGDGFLMELSAGECCPRCVECSTCVGSDPPPEPPVCDRSACPERCDDGYELTNTGDDCCSTCTPVIDLEACEAGRAEHAREFAAARDSFLPCATDAECMVIQASDACAMHCDLLVSGASFGQPFAELAESAAELCLHCPAPDFTCFGGPPPTARCVEGTCTLADR